MKTKHVLGLFLMASLISGATSLLHAEEDYIKESDAVLVNQKIDIDGVGTKKVEIQQQQIQAPAQEKTSEEILADAAAKAEKQNAKDIAKEIEKIKIPKTQVKAFKEKESEQLSQKFSEMFNDGQAPKAAAASTTVDQVKVQQAAPVVVEEVKEQKNENNIKIIPSFGVMNIKGTGSAVQNGLYGQVVQVGNIDFSSSVNAGLTMEAMVSSHFAVNVGFGYTTLNVSDMGLGAGYYDPYFTSLYGQGRTINFNNLDVSLGGKYFFTVDSRIKPFVGLELRYNKVNLSYADNTQTYNYNNYQYGNESYSSNYLTGGVLVGTEISFTKNVGLNLEFKYDKALSQTTSSNASSLYYDQDQQRLTSIGDGVANSSFAILDAGLVISF